ncbi:hypothetical protein J19TS2_59190 [Cohnella xylanilytica]|uniref:Double zinc ribbon protein n=1 Tax=Cohnella xylanilytica TaxID=557555 RepID=A0A841TYM2_9BACL|nr:hypothetical protein [Cohnella xylanilytica]MBB6692659.1 hypothetical protein [Cohnella xylanilytica]GIO16364.1 hypothetical protein J19TS2_59190 [Cohnella xylanilytica]
MAKKEELEPCVRCFKMPDENDKYCTDCGAPLQNRCFDAHGPLKKGCSFVNAKTAAYCAKCGEPTLFNLHGLVTPAYPTASRPNVWLGKFL